MIQHPDTTCTTLGKHFQRTHREVCEIQTGRAKDRQKRKDNTLPLTRAGILHPDTTWYKPGGKFSEDTYTTESRGVYPDTTCTYLGKHFQRTHTSKRAEVCEMQTGRAKTRLTDRNGRKTHYVRAGVYMYPDTYLDTTCTNLGKHFQSHRVVCEMQAGHTKDCQTETEGKHTNSHACRGVYILTQCVQTWGNICRGHIRHRGV